MSLTKRAREPELFKLSVSGRVTVHVSNGFVAAQNAEVVRADTLVKIGDLPRPPKPQGNGRAPASSVDWGKLSKTVPADPRKQITFNYDQRIDEITASEMARIVITDVESLHKNLLLSVCDEASVVLPNKYLSDMQIVASGRGSVSASNALDCMWTTDATIKASDSGSVRGLKVMKSLTATADERAEVSLIVAKDAVTRHSGPVHIVRTK